MLDRPILFYSDYCIHSTNFINALMKHQELFDLFIRINIDIEPETKRRPIVFYELQSMLNCKISEIPTIIIEGGKYILTGEEAFKWLEQQLSLIEKDNELTPFNPNEMGSFSDSYACYGSNDINNATEQTFKFLSKPDERINTPAETSSSVSKEDYSKKQQEREKFINITPPQTQQKQLTPQQIQQSQFNKMYTNSHKRNGKVSEKQQDFDQRLQQMMMERESLDPPKIKINPNAIDFQSGKIN